MITEVTNTGEVMFSNFYPTGSLRDYESTVIYEREEGGYIFPVVEYKYDPFYVGLKLLSVNSNGEPLDASVLSQPYCFPQPDTFSLTFEDVPYEIEDLPDFDFVEHERYPFDLIPVEIETPEYFLPTPDFLFPATLCV